MVAGPRRETVSAELVVGPERTAGTAATAGLLEPASACSIRFTPSTSGFTGAVATAVSGSGGGDNSTYAGGLVDVDSARPSTGFLVMSSGSRTCFWIADFSLHPSMQRLLIPATNMDRQARRLMVSLPRCVPAIPAMLISH